jgi:membrane associated rhomboid family serine protease
MLIPVGTDRPLRRTPSVTYALVLANLAAFVAVAILDRLDPAGAARALSALLLDGPHLAERWWTPASSMFLHASAGHLFGNMLVLFVFGPNLEDRLGRWWFLLFYLAGGLAAAGLHVAFDDTPALGASGAIAAITGAYLVLFPRTLVRCFFIIFLSWVQVPAWIFIGLAIAWSDLLQPAFVGGRGVAHLAHLGGYAFGISVSMILLWRRVLPREPYDLFTVARQAYRRRQIREAAALTARQVDRRVGAAARRSAEDEARAEAVAAARAVVAAHLARGETGAAAAAYREMVDRFADMPGAVTLSRQHQYDLANYFFQQRDHQAALFAYERFLESYARDGHAASVRLMVALISARYLNDPVRAKRLLADLEPLLADEAQKRLARELTEELA